MATSLIEALFILSIFLVREVPAVVELTKERQVKGLDRVVLIFEIIDSVKQEAAVVDRYSELKPATLLQSGLCS